MCTLMKIWSQLNVKCHTSIAKKISPFNQLHRIQSTFSCLWIDQNNCQLKRTIMISLKVILMSGEFKRLSNGKWVIGRVHLCLGLEIKSDYRDEELGRWRKFGKIFKLPAWLDRKRYGALLAIPIFVRIKLQGLLIEGWWWRGWLLDKCLRFLLLLDWVYILCIVHLFEQRVEELEVFEHGHKLIVCQVLKL